MMQGAHSSRAVGSVRSDAPELLGTAATSGAATSAAETVMYALRENIIEGRLPPGTRLIDASVAEQHGVSRNTARDALRLLTAAGLTVSVRNAGYRVRELSIADIRDLYAARRIIETGAVLQSVTADAELFEAVEDAVERTEAAVAAGEWARVGTWSLNFHRALVGLAMSPTLDGVFVSAAAQLRLAFAVISDEGAFQLQWVGRDREIAEFVLSGAREEAAAALISYMNDSEARVIDAIRAATRLRARAAADPAAFAAPGVPRNEANTATEPTDQPTQKDEASA